MKAVSTPKAPKAIGPYSQAMRVDKFLFLSGQIPLDPETGAIVGTTIEEQTERVLRNIEAILQAENLSWKNVVKTTVFIKDMNEFAKFNAIYEKALTAPFPARSTVEVARLPKDVKIEIETIASAS